MNLVSAVAGILSSILSLYFLILLVRVVLDWIQVFARQWRPQGIVLVLANLVYALTDPPLRVIRRRVPMARRELYHPVVPRTCHLNRCEVVSEPLECCSHVSVR